LSRSAATVGKPVDTLAHATFCVLREQVIELPPVERGGVVLPDCVAVALLPVAEDVAQEIARPRGAAFEEGEKASGTPLIKRATAPRQVYCAIAAVADPT
jgi:hypothetical protein